MNCVCFTIQYLKTYCTNYYEEHTDPALFYFILLREPDMPEDKGVGEQISLNYL